MCEFFFVLPQPVYLTTRKLFIQRICALRYLFSRACSACVACSKNVKQIFILTDVSFISFLRRGYTWIGVKFEVISKGIQISLTFCLSWMTVEFWYKNQETGLNSNNKLYLQYSYPFSSFNGFKPMLATIFCLFFLTSEFNSNLISISATGSC